jgi:glycosyltransferase involved in cell wall biosynthesis
LSCAVTVAYRILHFLPSIDTRAGGPIRAVFDLSDAMARRGHAVTIATAHVPAEGVPAAMTGEVNPRVVVLTPGLIKGHWIPAAARATLKELMAAHQLAHVHGVWDTSNVQVGRMATAMGKPYFVSVRGMLDDWCMEQKRAKKLLFHTVVGKRHLNGAADIHLTADAELDQARKWFDPRKGTVIANLLNLDPYRSAPGPHLAREKFACLREGRPVVLFLSRIHYKKGAEVLLEAASQLKAANVDASFVLAGPCDDDYRAQLDGLANRLGVGDRVHFVGHVGGELKVSLYQAATLMALPTSQENFGFVFPESLAAGTPVITTKGVDIWPSLERGGGSLIVERTARAFADAIGRLLRDAGLRARMSEAGKAQVFVEYDEARIAQQFEAMYAKAL